LIGHLRANQIKIVVTAHDLTPHSKRPEYYDPLYQAWLSAADGIIHHSEWGAEALRARYKVPEETKNAMVLNLGRSDMTRVTTPTERAAIEAALGLAKVPIRIGIVGTPRKEKLVVEFLEGFARTIRDDMQITCWSLAEHEVVPDDRRIAIAERYRPVSNRTFRKRLAVCDVIAIPYQSDGEMLTTGLTGSAMEVGIGILRTDWPFLEEVFGDAGIYVGNDVESFAAGLSRLTIDEIRLAQEASLELRRSHSWRTMAEEYGKFYDSVLAG
jgi:glycosyltransferase involved in cell wall biosynthesis